MTAGSPRVLVSPPLIFAGLLGAGLVIDGNWHDFGLPQLFAIALLVAALLLIGSALDLFRRAHTRPEPWQPASSLVVRGTYRFTRNPMYLGLLLILAGWAAALANAVAVVLLPGFVAYVTRFQILPEERILRSRFGAEFEAYARTVRRWL